jgi:hypothetical protein
MKTLKITTEAEYYKAIATMQRIGDDENLEHSKKLQDKFDNLAMAISKYDSLHLPYELDEDEWDLIINPFIMKI